MITVEHCAGADALLEQARGHLLEKELENNFLLSMLGKLVGGEPGGGYFAVLRGPDGLLGAVAQSPLQIVTTELPEEAIETVAGDLDARLPEMPNLFGPRSTAEALAAILARRRGRRVVAKMRSTLYVLDRLTPPSPPVPGDLRAAHLDDLPRAASWLEAFLIEATPMPMNAEAMARRLIADGELVFWRHRGEDVSMGGLSGRSPNGARLAWIYTPPELRGRGYAAGLTAAYSQHLLDSGTGFCCLYADLKNPVSNRLYRRLGYRAVGQVAEMALVS